MKLFTGTAAEATRLQELDAKASGLPLPGVLVGFGPRKAIGGGPVDGDWFGWTRWKYVTENGTYSVDEQLESATDPKSMLTAAERIELAAMLSKAKPVTITEIEK